MSTKYWIWLATALGQGSKYGPILFDHFGTVEKIYLADENQYQDAEIPPKIIAKLMDKSTEKADVILGECNRLYLVIMTYQDADYPEQLRQIIDPPLVLYIRGRRISFDQYLTIGVVGTRRCSAYGVKATTKIALELATAGAMVVTGMAEGIDTSAVLGALKAGGPLVSVVAGGVNVAFPRENWRLYEDVTQVGAVISEYPPNTPHRGDHFPVRNRLISGLSQGVFVPECELRSGTMITVRCALEQNRDLFALPGNVDIPMSVGPNRLIQEGATLVQGTRDILGYYQGRFPLLGQKLSATATAQRVGDVVEQLEKSPKNHEKPQKPPKVAQSLPDSQPETQETRVVIPLAEQEKKLTDDQIFLLRAIGDGVCSPDQLVELTQIPAKRVLSALTMLQVQEMVVEVSHRKFSSCVRLEQQD